tara:strand:+ start:2115 stop:2267 length:153 start_codon:yes stop_codon:yes gene_type:complete
MILKILNSIWNMPIIPIVSHQVNKMGILVTNTREKLLKKKNRIRTTIPRE